jgi:hypothetical protein
LLPNTHKDKPVTEIGADFIYTSIYYHSLRTIRLPTGLQKIGAGAFWLNDANLNHGSLVLPETLTDIGTAAFRGCDLRNVTFGSALATSSLATLGDYAFAANDLTTIALPDSLQSIPAGAFSGNAITAVRIGSGAAIASGSALGSYGDAFKAHYDGAAAKAAGVYVYSDGSWEGPFTL